MLLNMINFTAYVKIIDKKKMFTHKHWHQKTFIYIIRSFFFVQREKERKTDSEHMIFFQTLLTDEIGIKYKRQYVFVLTGPTMSET